VKLDKNLTVTDALKGKLRARETAMA